MSKGHRWGNSHDGERVICINCECSPMSSDAKERCLWQALFTPALALARRTDPETSREGAKLIDPKRGTRRWQVLVYLRARLGSWVPSHEMCTAEIGGSEGLRRLRELRTAGWPIETKVLDGGPAYRLNFLKEVG